MPLQNFTAITYIGLLGVFLAGKGTSDVMSFT